MTTNSDSTLVLSLYWDASDGADRPRKVEGDGIQ